MGCLPFDLALLERVVLVAFESFRSELYIYDDFPNGKKEEEEGQSLITTVTLIHRLFAWLNLQYFWPNVISFIPDLLGIITTCQIMFLVTWTVQAKLKTLIEQVLKFSCLMWSNNEVSFQIIELLPKSTPNQLLTFGMFSWLIDLFNITLFYAHTTCIQTVNPLLIPLSNNPPLFRGGKLVSPPSLLSPLPLPHLVFFPKN